MAPRMLTARTPGRPAAPDSRDGGGDDPVVVNRAPPPWALGGVIAALLGVAYLAIAPPAADLAAATYRSDLFGRAGFTLWDNDWYAGHHLPGYSLLSPALGHLLGPRLLLVVSAVAAAALFGSLARAGFGESAARVATAWFAVGVSVGLLSGRVPYYLGLAIGLGALLAFSQGLTATALVLAAVTSVASPVAGAFLALAGLACAGGAGPVVGDGLGDGLVAVVSRIPRAPGVGLAAAALAPAIALAIAFPEGGYEPFAPSAFWPALAGVALTGVLLGSRHRPLRAGIALYALALAGSFFLHTPVGGNAARLGALVAGPLVGASLWSARSQASATASTGLSPTATARTASTRSWRPLLLAALVPVSLYWQLVTPVRDLSLVADDPSVGDGLGDGPVAVAVGHASYFAPLVAELGRLSAGRPVRVEVPLTGAHSEADQLAGHVLLARGWERQLDTRYAAVFYRRTLTPAAYRAWLLDNAVAYVAAPDVRLDAAGRREGVLIARGVPFLSEVWRSAHWRLYALRGARALVDPPATVTAVGVDQVTLRTPRTATVTLRVRYSPYWALGSGHGCVSRAPGGWTSLRLSAPGPVRLHIDFSPARIFDRAARCRS